MMGLSIMRKQDIERQVTALLTQYGYSFDYDTSIDVVDFVRRLGFTVGNADLPDNEDGFLAIKPGNSKNPPYSAPEKIIGVNADRNLALKRFIIAHEFAHWVLHYKDGEVLLHRESRKGKGSDENDADYFAAALLMPRKSFLRVYNDLKSNGLNDNVVRTQLAATFKTPFESASRRIDEICSGEI